jgi:putative spermidine/putrescine transport system ATP-binding protein
MIATSEVILQDAAPDLLLEGVSKAYGDVAAVDDISFEVRRGQFYSLLGPSGCGKTTTLRLVAGFERADAGRILLAREDITDTPPNRRRVNTVFQHYALFPHLTVEDNVSYGLRQRKLGRGEVAARLDEALRTVRLEDLRGRYPRELSGGQQQRVALARALAGSPTLLLLDEPLSALDAKIRVELRSEIRRIQQQLGITTIYVTHDQEEALSISDRIVVMSAGNIEQIGTPFEIYNFPQTPFAASFVGHLNLLPVTVVDATHADFNGHIIELGQATKFEKGKHARLASRPEEFRLGQAEGRNMIDGTVESVTFLGSIVRTRVDLGGAFVSVDLFNERQLTLPQIGEKVTVSFPSHACWLME